MIEGEKNTKVENHLHHNNMEIKAFYEKKGASRAITSGIFILVSSLLGSLLLWIFMIIGTGTGGLEYFLLATSIGTLFLTFSTGFSASFVARIKDISLKNPKKTNYYIGSYSRILILISIILTIIGFLIVFFIKDIYFRTCLIFSIPQIFIGYISGIMINLLNVDNRYDITGVIGGLYGIFAFITGFLFIYVFHVPDIYYGLIPLITGIANLGITLILFKKYTKFSFIGLLKQGNMFNSETRDFIKYSFLTTITNLDILGVFGNIIIFITAIILGFQVPESEKLKLMELFAIVNGYLMMRFIILFFSGPLNVEIAEANSNNDIISEKETINKMGKISLLFGLFLMIFLSAFSKTILKFFHSSAFITSNNTFNNSLYDVIIIFFIISTFGQFFYAFSSFFANALIGSGNVKKSSKGFGLILILCIILTPIFVYYYGLIGASLVMIVTGSILLPYMLHQVKKTFQIETDFRVLRQMPYLVIIGTFLFLFPVGEVFGALLDMIFIFGVSIIILSISLPFFGVIDKKDYYYIEEILRSLKLEKFNGTIIKFNDFFLKLNPLNKKLLKN